MDEKIKNLILNPPRKVVFMLLCACVFVVGAAYQFNKIVNNTLVTVVSVVLTIIVAISIFAFVVWLGNKK